MAHPVTKEMWERLSEMAMDGDKNCHAAISKSDYQEAGRWNAYVDAVKELLNLPVDMISEKREENDA